MDDEAEAPLTSEETVGPTEKVETVPSFRPGIKRVRSSNDRIVALLEARRGEREKLLQTLGKEKNDDVDLFFQSIAMTVKKLRPHLISEAKLKTMQLMFELESRNTQYVPESGNTQYYPEIRNTQYFQESRNTPYVPMPMTSPESSDCSNYTYLTNSTPDLN